MQARGVGVGAALLVGLGAEALDHGLIERRQIVAGDRFARRDRDLPPAADRQHAAAHRAMALGAVAAEPADDRHRQASEEIGVARQDAEPAAGVLGAQRRHALLIDDDLERRDDA